MLDLGVLVFCVLTVCVFEFSVVVLGIFNWVVLEGCVVKIKG